MADPRSPEPTPATPPATASVFWHCSRCWGDKSKLVGARWWCTECGAETTDRTRIILGEPGPVPRDVGNPSVPLGEIHIRDSQNGALLGKIVNVHTCADPLCCTICSPVVGATFVSPPPSEDGGLPDCPVSHHPCAHWTGEPGACCAVAALLASPIECHVCECPASYDELTAAYLAQIEHTNLVRAEYQARVTALESRLATAEQARQQTVLLLDEARQYRDRAEQERDEARRALAEAQASLNAIYGVLPPSVRPESGS